MTEQELKDLFELLRSQGWEPQLCDTPVPYYDNAVPCGVPSDPGDVVQGDYVLLPGELLRCMPTMVLPVRGDSMRDVGIETGDHVTVQLDVEIHDGDVVLASIDGECTLKAYYKDEEDRCWLVPRNDNYAPILLNDKENVRLLGRVVEVSKKAPHNSFRDMQRIVKLSMKEATKAKSYTEEDVRSLLREVFGETMAAASDWIAVYRILVDRCGVPSSHTAFAEYVNGLGIEGYPPCTRDVLRKADPIYLRPIFEWDSQGIHSAAHKRRVSIARHLRQIV